MHYFHTESSQTRGGGTSISWDTYPGMARIPFLANFCTRKARVLYTLSSHEILKNVPPSALHTHSSQHISVICLMKGKDIETHIHLCIERLLVNQCVLSYVSSPL